MNRWITDWNDIGDQTRYLVCPINADALGKRLHLGQPTGFMMGWEVKRLMKRCYAAIELPEFVMPERGET